MALVDNLVAYWSMDEASGTRLDSYGSNHLTDNNTVASGTGKINSAADFEADNSEYLHRSDNTDLSTGDIDFTFAGWIKYEDNSVGRSAWSKFNTSSFEYLLTMDPLAGSWRWYVSNDGSSLSHIQSTFGMPSTGTWYFLVTWHDSVNNEIGIAVNAGTPNTTSYSAGVFDGTSEFRIGMRQDAFPEPMDGLIDEVGFWKRVLTSQERTDLYNGGSGYPFSEWGVIHQIGGGLGGSFPFLQSLSGGVLIRPAIFAPGLGR